MKELFQSVVMRLALCGVAVSLVLLALRSRMVRETFARLLSVWRSLTAFGRVAVCSFLLLGVLVGGDKTNGVPLNMNSPLPQIMQGGIIQGGAASCRANMAELEAPPPCGTPHLLATLPNSGFAARKAGNWNVRGAWKDSFWLPFEDGWVFPHGTNHLSGVEVVSYGEVWATPFGDAVAPLGVPVEIVPGLSAFGYEHTPSNSYRFVWTDAAINRDTNNLLTASIELFRDGGVSVTTNGVAAYLPRELPFEHHGYGQDAEWVTANFTNATEILSVGYPQWVDAQVGTSLTNGLYKLTVTVADDPPETTQISVGGYSVAVTNAGEYVFLLEKGPAFDLAVFPPSDGVAVSAVDDIAAMRSSALRGGFVETALPTRAGGDGTWTPDGGGFWTDYAAGMGHARFWWLPWLCGSPDVTHIDANAGAVEFHANLVDYRREQPVFQWTASEGLAVASPNSQTTQVAADGAVAWARASMTVTASFGYDRSLVSYLYVSYGTESEPPVSCALSVQNVHFINEGDRPERVYPVSVSLLCPVETNGVVNISHEGSDGALFWSDAAATQPLQSLSGISLSSVEEGSGGASYTFYMTSPTIGSGSFTATFTLPNGDTRGVAKSYRVIEPIRRLVCCEIDGQYSCVYNPSRLVYEHPARLKVGANGNYSPHEVEWRVVSGPGVVTRDEDEFGDVGWGATVAATAQSGEVVVEARFNEDAIQPRFVLPIVREKAIPVETYVVCDSNGVASATRSEIDSKIASANVLLRQIGIALVVVDSLYEIQRPEYFCLREHEVITNANGAVRLRWGVSQDVMSLAALAHTNAALKTFWVGAITNGTPIAFSVATENAVFMSPQTNGKVLAHEVGHVLGLEDVYDVLKHYERGRSMVQVDEEVRKGIFGDPNRDWGQESGRGFYPEGYVIRNVIQDLLMYGYNRDGAFDIPSGTVHGLHEWSRNVLERKDVKVGAENTTIHEGK